MYVFNCSIIYVFTISPIFLDDHFSGIVVLPSLCQRHSVLCLGGLFHWLLLVATTSTLRWCLRFADTLFWPFGSKLHFPKCCTNVSKKERKQESKVVSKVKSSRLEGRKECTIYDQT